MKWDLHGAYLCQSTVVVSIVPLLGAWAFGVTGYLGVCRSSRCCSRWRRLEVRVSDIVRAQMITSRVAVRSGSEDVGWFQEANVITPV